MQNDTLYIYDGAIKDWAMTFVTQVAPGNPPVAIDATFATPDRPYGKFKNQEEFKSAYMKNPVVSITRGDLQYAPDHRENGVWSPVKVTNDGKPYISCQYPRPYRIQYQLDLRTRRRRVANLWLQWFYFKLNPIIRLSIDFQEPWGVKLCDLELMGRIVDNSDLESGDKERWIRYTATVELLAFMFPSVTDLATDVPDMFGQLTRVPDIRHIQVDAYASQEVVDYSVNPSPDDPNNELAFSLRRDVIETPANLQIESE